MGTIIQITASIVVAVCAVIGVTLTIRHHRLRRKRASAEDLRKILESWGSQDMHEAKKTVLRAEHDYSISQPYWDGPIVAWWAGSAKRNDRDRLDEMDRARHKCLHHFVRTKSMKDGRILNKHDLHQAAKPADVAFLRNYLKRLTERLKPDSDTSVLDFFENLYENSLVDKAAARHYP